MATTMKAAVVHEFGRPLRIEDVPVPEPGPDQILVKIEACGVCHTDLHAADGDWPVRPTPPFIPGHEGVGHVAAVGRDAKGVKEGDRVGVPWLHSACGRCRYCMTGWETLCAEQKNTGYSVNGGFAEYVLADPDFVGHLPDGLEFAPAAPILCAGVTVYKGLKETDARPGDTVVISGIGGLGHLAVQYARAMGMHVIAVDVAEDKLNLAKTLGAEGHVSALRRERVGPFSLENAVTLDSLEEMVHRGAAPEGLLPVATALDDIPELAVTDQDAFQLRQGRSIVLLPRQVEILKARLTGDSRTVSAFQDGTLVALCSMRAGRLEPDRVFNLQ